MEEKEGIIMASQSASAPWSMAQLLEAIKQLAPAERRELQRQLFAWQAENGGLVKNDEELRRAARARLPTTEERRLRRLIRKSEQGTLTSTELAEYRALAQRAEQLNAERTEALAELIWRRGKPAHIVCKEIGAEGDADGA